MVLPGVTRDSVLSLARAHADPNDPFEVEGLPKGAKFIVSERNLTMPQIVEASKDGSLKEMFGTGTVSCLLYSD